MMTEEERREIEKMSYEEMLSKWRFAPIGDPFFQDDRGEYFAKALSERRREVGNDVHVATSKRIGWIRP